jgi:ABC-type lipoprotein release transport system permease subunit
MSITLPFRNVARSKVRTYLIIAAITISVGLETGIAITLDSLMDDFIERQRGTNYTDIKIQPKFNSSIEDITNLAANIKSIKGLENVGAVATFLVDANSSGLGGISTKKEKILLYGLDPDSHPDYSHLEITSDDDVLEPPNVIVSWSIAKEVGGLGWELNLPMNVSLGFKGLNATVRGVLSDGSTFGNYIGYFFILVDLDYFVDLFTVENLDFHITMMVKDVTTINKLAEQIQDLVGVNYEVIREKSVREMDILAIQAYQAGMTLIIIASIIVEFLFITNTLSMNIKDRQKEFGTLRAIGTSNFQLISFLSIEFLIYAGIASALGIFLGIGFSNVSVFILNFNFSRLRIHSLSIKFTTLLTAYVTGIVITLMAGLYPIIKAISLPVIQNIHWVIRRKKGKRQYWPYFLILGAILTVVGIFTGNTVGAGGFLEFQIFSWQFFTVWSIFLGVFLFETGLLHFLPNLGKLMLWYRSMPRTIATRNIQRESQKSTLTVMVTGLALSFILIMGITSTALVEYVPEYYNNKFGRIEIIAEATDDADLSLAFINELVENNSNIESATFMQQQRTKIEGVDGYVFGVEPDSFGYYIEELITMPTEPDVSTLLNSTEKGAIISDKLLSRIGAKVGEELSIQITSNSSITVKLTGIMTANPFLKDGIYLFISSAIFLEFWSNEAANWFVIKTSPDSILTIVASQIEGKYPSLREVIPIDYYARVIESSLKTTTIFFQLLVFYTFLLSGLAQFLSILMSILRMQREMGIMRSIGLSQSAVQSIFSIESILLGTTGIIIGIINGIIGTELLTWYISFSIPIQAELNLQIILIWSLISFIITIASSEITTRRTMDTIIADALSGESLFNLKSKKAVWREWGTFLESQERKKPVLTRIELNSREKEKKGNN